MSGAIQGTWVSISPVRRDGCIQGAASGKAAQASPRASYKLAETAGDPGLRGGAIAPQSGGRSAFAVTSSTQQIANAWRSHHQQVSPTAAARVHPLWWEGQCGYPPS